jgi:hypothetical protein
LFAGKGTHSLQVEIPIEPVAIIWQNLNNSLTSWLWRKMVLFGTFVSTLLLSALFSALIYLLSKYGDTLLGAITVALLNAATPVFVMVSAL